MHSYSYTHISVRDLYISRIGLSISLQQNMWTTDPGNKLLTDTWMWDRGRAIPRKGKHKWDFRCSAYCTYLGSAWRNSCSPPCPWAWSRQSASPAPGAWSRPGRWAPSPDPRRLPPPSSPSAGSCTPSLPPAHQPRTIGAAKKGCHRREKDDFYSGLMSCTKGSCQTRTRGSKKKDLIGGKRRLLLQRIGVMH